MNRIAGFIDSVTGKIVTSEEAREGRRVHRGVANLAAHDAKYNWVWQADAAGTLLAWHVEDGKLYQDSTFDAKTWRRVQEFVRRNNQTR